MTGTARARTSLSLHSQKAHTRAMTGKTLSNDLTARPKVVREGQPPSANHPKSLNSIQERFLKQKCHQLNLSEHFCGSSK